MAFSGVPQGPWSYLLRDPSGQNLTPRFPWMETEFTITMTNHVVRFENQSVRRVAPSQTSVRKLATDIMLADDSTRAAILLHYSYWPTMVSSVLEEVHRRMATKRKADQLLMRGLRKKWARIDRDSAPPASATPAVIALPDGSVHGTYPMHAPPRFIDVQDEDSLTFSEMEVLLDAAMEPVELEEPAEEEDNGLELPEHGTFVGDEAGEPEEPAEEEDDMDHDHWLMEEPDDEEYDVDDDATDEMPDLCGDFDGTIERGLPLPPPILRSTPSMYML